MNKELRAIEHNTKEGSPVVCQCLLISKFSVSSKVVFFSGNCFHYKL